MGTACFEHFFQLEKRGAHKVEQILVRFMAVKTC